MTQEVFCPTCEDYRQVRFESREETYKVRGRDIAVPVQAAVCSVCGQGVGTDEDDDRILSAVYAEYRRRESLLTPEEIKQTRKRYRLSQEAFALLLGMSPATVNRYERGALQEPSQDAAIRACSDPDFVRGLLQRRGQVLTAWQKQRAEQALVGQTNDAEALLETIGEVDWICMPRGASIFTGCRRFDYRRFAAVAVWFCGRLRTVCLTVICKLLFYADFLNYKTSTASLTGAAYRKLAYGPVPADYHGLLTRMDSEGILASQEVPYGQYVGTDYSVGPNADSVAVQFTPHETAVLEKVAATFERWSAKKISDWSHRELAWLTTPDRELIPYDTAKNLSLSLGA